MKITYGELSAFMIAIEPGTDRTVDGLPLNAHQRAISARLHRHGSGKRMYENWREVNDIVKGIVEAAQELSRKCEAILGGDVSDLGLDAALPLIEALPDDAAKEFAGHVSHLHNLMTSIGYINESVVHTDPLMVLP